MSDPIATARELLARAGVALDDAASPADVVAALAGAEATADRATRKEIRRALYRLDQAGVHAPAAPPAAGGATTSVLGPMIEAWTSAVDGRGDRLAWLVREQPSGGLVLVAAEINEPLGLRDLRALEPTRKQLRTMRQRFQTDAALTLVPADWRAVDALVVEAQDRLETPDRKLDYRRMRSRITSQPPAAATELVSSRVHEPDDEERARLTAESSALLAEPELRTWWPRPEEAAPVLAEIRAIRESPLVVSQAQQEDRLKEVLTRASRSLYPAAVVARRLQATAFVLACIGTVCWAVCFWWMHRISSRQDATLKELRDVTARIEKLSQVQHDLIKDVHPQVSEIKEHVQDVREVVSPEKN